MDKNFHNLGTFIKFFHDTFLHNPLDYSSAPLHIIGTFRYKHTLNGLKRIPYLYLTLLSVTTFMILANIHLLYVINSLQNFRVVTVHYILFEKHLTDLGDNMLWIGYCPWSITRQQCYVMLANQSFHYKARLH